MSCIIQGQKAGTTLNDNYGCRQPVLVRLFLTEMGRKSSCPLNPSWGCRKPVLVLAVPAGEAAADGPGSFQQPLSVTFRLIPVASAAPFPLQKLAPGRNNLRDHVKPAGSSADDATGLLATPSYNAAILQVGPAG